MKPHFKKLATVFGFVIILFLIIWFTYFLVQLIGGDEAIKKIQTSWKLFESFLLKNGFWLFVSIAILPGLILPCAPLLILAGIWGNEAGVGIACLYSILALIINLIWTYWFAYGIGNRVINKILKKFGHEIPQLPNENLLQWSVIFRLTPGVPFIFSNYTLGLLKMPFVKYLLVSIPIISITDCGFILASAGIFGGNWKYIWGGISILVILVIFSNMISKKRNAN